MRMRDGHLTNICVTFIDQCVALDNHVSCLYYCMQASSKCIEPADLQTSERHLYCYLSRVTCHAGCKCYPTCFG